MAVASHYVNTNGTKLPEAVVDRDQYSTINTRPRRSTSTSNSGSLSIVTPPPPFTEADRDVFRRIFFDELNPRYGLLEAAEAQTIFSKHGLSPKHFWQIWHLADTKHAGVLDQHEFALAMYHVREFVSGRLATIPSETPQWLYNEIVAMYRGLKLKPLEISPQVSASTSDAPQSPKNLLQHDQQHAERPEPGGRHSRRTRSSISSASTASPIAATASTSTTDTDSTTSAEPWGVSPIARASAKEYFDVLDSQGVGHVEGDVAAKFMLKFKLKPEDLAHIWDLADLNHDNRLSMDGFAIAIHLIQLRLSGGEIPHVLPPSLIPPSHRSKNPFLHQKYPSQPVVPSSNISTSNAQHRLRRHTTVPSTLAKPEPGVSRTRSNRVASTSSINVAPRLQNGPSNVSSNSPPMVPVIPELDPRISEAQRRQQELEQENHSLVAKIQELTAQVGAQRDLQLTNADLTAESTSLKAKLHDTEQLMVELLHANEAHITTQDENQALSRRIAELEQDKFDASSRLESAKEENRDLGRRLQAVRHGARVAMVRSQEGVQELRRKAQEFEQDNEELRRRCADMEEIISRRQTQEASTSTTKSGSTANVQEMEILMGDVTRENESLKHRMRQMQRSTTQFLLMPNGGDQAMIDTLRRENIRLTNQVQEMEHFARQLERSAEDGELQLMLRDVTQENEVLKEGLRDMSQQIAQMKQQLRELGTSRQPERSGPLQREISRLKTEVQRLQMELRVASSSSAQVHDDPSVPPPAYED